MFEHLADLETELDKLEAALPEIYAAGDQAASRDAGRRRAELRPIVDAYREYRAAASGLVDARELMASEDDAEMREYLRGEIAEQEAALAAIEARLRELLVPKDPNDGRNVILEIRGAEGGEEANLWAADLARMYEALARRHGWRFETLSSVQCEPLYDEAEDAIYFGSNDGALYKAAALDGTLLWRFNTNAEVARALGRSLSTIERKLQVIRALWQDGGLAL